MAQLINDYGLLILFLIVAAESSGIPVPGETALITAGVAASQGHLDKVPVAKVREWEAGFVRFLRSERSDVLATIEKQKALDDPLFERLKAAISTFNHQFGVEGYQDAPDPGGKAADAAKPSDKPQPKAQAPATKAEPKPAAPAKVEAAEAPTNDEAEGRPSQLNQIRAAIADTPADAEPKPRRQPRKPKAN